MEFSFLSTILDADVKEKKKKKKKLKIYFF